MVLPQQIQELLSELENPKKKNNFTTFENCVSKQEIINPLFFNSRSRFSHIPVVDTESRLQKLKNDFLREKNEYFS